MKNGVKSIQTAGYNGACTVDSFEFIRIFFGLSTGPSINYVELLLVSFSFYGMYYRTGAIIIRGLYFFYPIFHCGLYCRAVYIAARLVYS